MKKLFLLLVVFCLFFTGCATLDKMNMYAFYSSVKISTDEFKNTKSIDMIDNKVKITSDPRDTSISSRRNVSILPSLRQEDGKNYLILWIEVKSWDPVRSIGVGGKESLYFNIDGEIYALSTTATVNFNRDREWKQEKEYIYYYITNEFLEKIAYATSVKYKIYGSDSSIEGVFDKYNIQNIRLFYENYTKDLEIEF